MVNLPFECPSLHPDSAANATPGSGGGAILTSISFSDGGRDVMIDPKQKIQTTLIHAGLAYHFGSP